MTAEELNAIAVVVEQTLREIAVPKPSRTSEHFAALTLAIVILREKLMEGSAHSNLIEREIEFLIKKRIKLESEFEAADEQAGGS